MAIEALTLPTDLFPKSYSGMGTRWQDFSQNQTQPILQSLLQDFPQYADDAYGGASKGIGNFTQNQMMPAVQGTLNSLAGRNMINSSVASDALSKTMTGLGNSAQGYQAGLAGQGANAKMQLPGFATDVAGMGQYSESSNALAPYSEMAAIIRQMMGG